MHHVVAKGDEAAVRSRLDAGADANVQDDDGATPLHWAADRGLTSMAALLLEAGANHSIPDESGMTPLHYAAMNDRDEVIKIEFLFTI